MHKQRIFFDCTAVLGVGKGLGKMYECNGRGASHEDALFAAEIAADVIWLGSRAELDLMIGITSSNLCLYQSIFVRMAMKMVVGNP